MGERREGIFFKDQSRGQGLHLWCSLGSLKTQAPCLRLSARPGWPKDLAVIPESPIPGRKEERDNRNGSPQNEELGDEALNDDRAMPLQDRGEALVGLGRVWVLEREASLRAWSW